MQYKNIHLIYFSPTHTSAKISYAIAEGLEAETLSESDITCEGLKEPLLIGENELVIVAAPVYGGRVAETAMERIRMFQGKNTPVIPVVVYGNRDYEDALKELSDALSEQGFVLSAQGLLSVNILIVGKICLLRQVVRIKMICSRLRNLDMIR